MNVMTKQISPRLDQPVTAALRMLAIDAVEHAKSGHPGAPMGLAEVAAVLWRRYLRHNPANPAWPDRDRFVLSNGHASMLLYALLHLSGYDLPMSELKRFRQLHSKAPGHPEVGVTPGVETTTGPLGQGFANAVGMAIAEKTLAAQFNRPGHTIVDHRTFAIVGDGCLMEGISHEAASLAGRLGLGKLIAIYDDNGISIDGKVAKWFADDTSVSSATAPPIPISVPNSPAARAANCQPSLPRWPTRSSPQLQRRAKRWRRARRARTRLRRSPANCRKCSAARPI